MGRFLSNATIGMVVAAAAVCGSACNRPAAPPATDAATATSADAGLYCKEHGVPEKFCTLCHEELKESLLLCKEHGDIPEDICTLCHPEVEKKYDIAMCPEGHGLPEHFCTECVEDPAA